ncbi:hypothetical protein Pan258_13920 [Symmachiella dynata]|uniref:restriction endonuclease n=1 Tax=Symmachiella dynata TaxID=2527995 RepID=UPI00118A86E5|nr:restriction endonuclease [Symmachiella dynata]QDT47358.1 hypothetical protein Pan258_13920 [Symmachiella dynata]
MPTKMTPAEIILKKNGPLDSKEFATALVASGSTANLASARKLIERAKKSGKIQSTSPIRFNKSFLYFLEQHWEKQYAQCLRKLLPEKPAFHRVFKTLLANKGWITHGQIGKASACLPSGDESGAGGRLPLENVVHQLLTLRLIEKVEPRPGIYRIGRQFGTTQLKCAVFVKKIELEFGLLEVFRDWVRTCFLLAYESHTIRPNEASSIEFNQTLCDMHGPIYFGPFAKASPLKRGAFEGKFMVAEILGYRQFTKNDAEATLERISSIGHRWKTIAVCPMVLAPSYSHPAWIQLRSAGVISLTFKDVFGLNIEELMKRFWRAISVEEVTPENLDDIENSLKLTQSTLISDGFIGNLKGALFELLIALLYRTLGHDTILQKIVRKPDEGKEYEIDVVARIGDAKCLLIECKGRHSGFEESKAEVKRHFHDRCRTAADAYGWNVTDHYENVEAVFITSGKLDSDAAAYAASTKSSHGISCSVMERKELLEFLKHSKQTRLVQIIEKYY